MAPLPRHCEERSDEAIQQSVHQPLDCFASLAMTMQGVESVIATTVALVQLALELDLRRLQLGLAVGAEIEEVLLCEAEHAGEQSGRETLDPGVVFLHRVVEEAA